MRRFLSKIKDALYDFLVRRDKYIKAAYEGYVGANQSAHRRNRLRSWLYLISLHVQRYILRRAPAYAPQEPKSKGPVAGESALTQRPSPEELAQQLSGFDAVTFDAFDTLIFRPFDDPTTLFYLVGEQIGYPDFRRLRIAAEKDARELKKMQCGTFEVTLEEIYDCLERNTGLERGRAMELEYRLEEVYCYGNPYMRQVVELLRVQGKKLGIISDMYLGRERLGRLLSRCGFAGFDAVLVSSDEGTSKHEGGLYRRVRSLFGESARLAHVGDHPVSDVKRAEENGFTPFYYPNVQREGAPYRPYNMSPLLGSAYRGVVNAALHNGPAYSPQYEYGFACGGPVVLGYCRFIHQYVQQHQIDRVLFLSRDGDVLKKAYDLLYPHNSSIYAYWSRLASAKLTAGFYKQDYFRRFVEHKIDTGVTVGQCIAAMELNTLFITLDEEKRQERLGEKQAAWLRQRLEELWPQVLDIYRPQCQAAKAYVSSLVEGCHRVCAVDVGWAGSGALSLSSLAERWGLDCHVNGLVAGTDTPYNPDLDTSLPFFASGKIGAYFYGPSFNRDLYRFHNPGADHNVWMEFLFSSCEGTVQGFYPSEDENGYRIAFGPPENVETVKQIQAGELDFVAQYQQAFAQTPWLMDIPGGDAYRPFQAAVQSPAYLRSVFSGIKFQYNVGDAPRPCV